MLTFLIGLFPSIWPLLALFGYQHFKKDEAGSAPAALKSDGKTGGKPKPKPKVKAKTKKKTVKIPARENKTSQKVTSKTAQKTAAATAQKKVARRSKTASVLGNWESSFSQGRGERKGDCSGWSPHTSKFM